MKNHKSLIVYDASGDLSVSDTCKSVKSLPSSVHVNFAYPFDKIDRLYEHDKFNYDKNLQKAFQDTKNFFANEPEINSCNNLLTLVAWYAYEKLELGFNKAKQITNNKQYCHLLMKATREDIIKNILTGPEKESIR